jgi:hypothetical protein
MRSRLTNILQVVVLLTGIIYVLIGASFFYSPIRFFEIFIDVPDDWLKLIEDDTFIAPLYYFTKTFSAMIFTSGFSMILPLYDPLKYRGLIYYTGIVFPAIAFPALLYHGIIYKHWILTTFGIVFLGVLLLNIFALAITRKEARSGIE